MVRANTVLISQSACPLEPFFSLFFSLTFNNNTPSAMSYQADFEDMAATMRVSLHKC